MTHRIPICLANSEVPMNSNVFHIIVEIWKREGPFAFYKGLGTTLIGIIPNWAIYFASYESSKSFLKNKKKKSLSALEINLISAIYAGVLTTIATSPLWVIRTRMMTQGEQGYKSIFHAFQEIYKHEGFRGFYHGLLPSIIGLFHVGIQFPLYEYIKTRRRNARRLSMEDPIPFTDVLFASTVSKLVASVSAYPHEVLRAQMQDRGHGHKTQNGTNIPEHLNFRGLFHLISLIYQHQGIRGFYKGIGLNLLRVVPSAGITLTVFEFCSKKLRFG